eukprot:TRINITY_DN3258_c0_g1_i1.p2 TRINITY_DN3258_c0_g1~~TRINITY_DN3258_c0_g1_i1.p2  ORF type:complete len:217 (-),score=43.49 TRINITY_DN3258_c0_g1_i1:92-742(-)
MCIRDRWYQRRVHGDNKYKDILNFQHQTDMDRQQQQQGDGSKFLLSENRFGGDQSHAGHKRENMVLEGFAGYSWGERITFTVGMCYFTASCVGATKGLIEGVPKKWNLPKKLILNNFFNSVGRNAARFGNASAAASLMYCVLGNTISLFFEDELANLTNFQKNVLFGALTGALYKSTLGLIPAGVGCILGASMIAGINYTIDYANQNGYIDFEMKF